MDTSIIIAIAIAIIVQLLRSVGDFAFDFYKNRLTNYTYKISRTNLGATVNHDFLGKIEIYHNGFFKQFLTLATIDIKNTGTKEHGDFKLHISVDDESNLLNSKAYYTDTGRSINLDPEYSHILKVVNTQVNIDNELMKENSEFKVSVDTQKKYDYLSGNCIFVVPTILSGKSITVNLLIENKAGLVPNILPTIGYPGIKLEEDKRDPLADLIKKTSFNLAVSVVGLFIYPVVIYFIVKAYPGSEWPVILIIITSALYGEFAALLIRLYKFIGKQIN
jgi:hypothetical protein